MLPIRIKACSESDLRMLGDLARNIQRVLPVTQADIDAAAALGKGWVVWKVIEVNDPIDNLCGGTQLVIKQNSITPGQNVRRVLIVSGPGGETVVIGPGPSPLLLPDAIADSLTYVKAFGGTEQRNLPDGYTQLEYIESTGTQWIDTGYKPKTGDKIRIVYQYNSLYGGDDGRDATSIFGCTGAASATDAYYGVARVVQGTNTINRIAWGHGGNSVVGDLTYNNATGVWYDLVCDNGVFTINDTQLGTTSANSFSANFSMYLFARNTGGTAGLITKGKIQIAQVWDNGTLVHNMIPAKNASNVVGMYDTVSGQFFTNAGTGTFIAGPTTVPTPDAPMDIVSNNGVLKVSKNLANFDDVKYNSSNFSFANGVLTGHGSDANFSFWVRNVKAGDAILISANYTSITHLSNFQLRDSNNNAISTGAVFSTTGIHTAAWTAPSNGDYRVNMRCSGDNSAFVAQDIMIEIGDNFTPYHPYGQIYTDGEVETIADSANHTATVATLLGVGDYRDTQNINTGAITRNVGVRVLDGTEDWNTNAFTDVFSLQDSSWIPSDGSPLYCSHFNNIVLPITAQREGNSWFNLGRFNIGWASMVAQGTTAFKQWLADQYAAGTPVIVVYPLATATTESVAGQTLQVTDGDNVLEITQASLNNLQLEAQYQAAVSLTIQEVQDANLDPNVEVTIN